jgi:hypothetical protein
MKSDVNEVKEEMADMKPLLAKLTTLLLSFSSSQSAQTEAGEGH